MRARIIAIATLLLRQCHLVLSRSHDESIVRVTTSDTVHPGGLANVYLTWLDTPPSGIEAVYTSCLGPNSSSRQQIIGRFAIRKEPPKRLAWVVPDDASENSCIYIHGNDPHTMTQQIIGKSEPIHLTQKVKKRSTADTGAPLLK